jgi:hypothetical protein
MLIRIIGKNLKPPSILLRFACLNSANYLSKSPFSEVNDVLVQEILESKKRIVWDTHAMSGVPNQVQDSPDLPELPVFTEYRITFYPIL